MNILVSNDDGILAKGIEGLAEACSAVGTVTVVSPDREQSATSHSLTLHRPLRATRRPDGAFQVDGTPTDCVLLAVGALLPTEPDWVFSGVNHGPNMGEDVLYSGTVAAAMEGLAAGIRSVAISYASFDIEHLPSYRASLRRLIERIVQVEDYPPETLLNINLVSVSSTTDDPDPSNNSYYQPTNVLPGTSITTTPNPSSAQVGTTLKDDAVITGTEPEGTVTFKLYLPSDPPCRIAGLHRDGGGRPRPARLFEGERHHGARLHWLG